MHSTLTFHDCTGILYYTGAFHAKCGQKKNPHLDIYYGLEDATTYNVKLFYGGTEFYSMHGNEFHDIHWTRIHVLRMLLLRTMYRYSFTHLSLLVLKYTI